MVATPKRRKINGAQFEKQLAEHVGAVANTIEYEVNAEDSVLITVPVGMDQVALAEFQERLRTASGSEEMALVILGDHPSRSAEEQLDLWRSTGRSTDTLALVFMNLTQDTQERLGNFRFGA